MAKRKAATSRQGPVSFTDEEPDFPRGGGSVLTPSEVREAEDQADTEFANEGKVSRKKQKKLDEFDRSYLVKIPKSVELLRYKSLSLGMKLWGVVLEVGKRDLVVSLPGGLRGFVKAVDALDFLSQDTDVNTFSPSSHDEGLRDVFLNEHFAEGQLVSCVVIQLDNVKLKESKKRSKRIGLSLRLDRLHNGLTIDAMHEGLVLSAFVTSIEDHGYLVSFGVPGITGFLRHSGGEAAIGAVSMLKKGQLLQGVILSIDKKRSMVMLRTDPDLVASSVAQEMEGLSMELLFPGTLVNARIRAVLKNGLLLSFLTYFTGMVTMFHLEDPLPPSNWQEKYCENQRLKARVLYVDNTNKSIGLSLNSQLVQNMAPTIGVKIGDLCEKATVRRVDITIGLLLELPIRDTSFAGYAHISDASDEHVEQLQEMFKEGKKTKARVIGKRLMDGLAVVTLKDSKVNQRVLSCADVHPGMTITGEITSVEAFGAFVKLADGVKALCPLQHMSEFQRPKPSGKFKVGARLKFRVLTCAADTKKITVTHKRTMLSSKLKPVATYEEAVEGLVTHGWISGIEDYGCFVCFYNNVKGLVHRTQLGLDPGVDPKSVFQTGQVVKCKVLRADSSAQRLSLSFVLSPSSLLGLHNPHGDEEKKISVGHEVCGLVTHVSDSLITLEVPLSNGVAKAFMKVELISDFAGHAEQLRSLLYPGYKFERLRVLERDDQKLVVTSKFSLLSAKFIPSDVSQLNPQEVISGYIASITDRGCFVRFLGGLTGLASLPQLLDGFVHSPFKHFAVGQSVRAKVLEVNLLAGRFNLSLKQSHCYSTDTTFLKGYFLEEEKIAELQASKSDGAELEWGKDIGVGKVIEGEIQDIKEYGVIVNVQNLKDVVGFVTHHQLDSEVKVGDHVTARILDVVKSDGILDLTLRSDLVNSGSVSTSQMKKIGRKRARAVMETEQKAWAIIELIKDEYLVCSLPDFDNAIAFAAAHDYNLKVDPHEKYTLGQRVEVSIGSLPAEGSEVGRLLLLLTSLSDPTGNSPMKRMRRLPKLVSQTLVEGEVLSVGLLGMKVRVGKNSVGKVHVTQVTDDFEGENPLSHYSVGQSITAKILGRSKQNDDGRLTKCFDLTLKPSELGGKSEDSSSFNTLSLSDLQVGQVVTAHVKEVEDDWAWLLISPSIMGRLFMLDSSTDPIQLGRFKAHYKVGQPVRCRIAKVDPENGKLDFSLRGLDPDSKYQEGHEVNINEVFGGRVSKILPGVDGLSVQIGCHLFGRVHITQLADAWKDNPTMDFKVGQFVRCIILDVSRSKDGVINQIDLSLRQSLINALGDKGVASETNTRLLPDPIVEKIEDLRVGMEVQGFVKSVIKKGCFVTLSRHLDARIKLSNLAENFIDDPGSLFPVGKLVKGRIISLEPLSGFVEMSLRRSLSKDELNDSKMLTLKEVHVGDVVTGVVARIESYGIFVSISNSKTVGLCHISQVSDNRISNLEALFKVGDSVQAKVLKVNEDKKQISLGMKDIYMKDLHVEEELPKDEIKVFHREEFPLEQVLETNVLLGKDESENENGHFSDSSLLPLSMPDITVYNSYVEPLNVLLDTDGTAPLEDVVKEDMDSPTKTEIKEKSSKRDKKRMKNLREAAIREAEQKRLEGDEAPESSEDFEKLVHESPNSSFVWIKYMAFLLSLGDADKARVVADRALQTINFREEGEKLNVWVALLNLENAYGNPAKEATLEVFRRALQYCDPKKLYFALLGIYERGGQHEMIDELLKSMLQKFKMSCKVWLKRIQCCLKQSMPEAAHKTLDRALLSLPQRKHIKAISQAAITEFRIGSAERARNLFESILRNYPKRVDLWSVYLDQEIVLGDASVVRALFERITSLELPPKKMKFLFKKYLEYEKSHGDEERVEYVKGKAMQYVETRIG
ncbi:hypothetical protein GOP47_0016734 [Adiantum capillus-veneris]|uniref:rRNA biogenesis protein RRP5 n=1 Tax=Adiantum capillus-veneris TaxID=13818 RepID=A0A9D4UI90_ADICA|nr:hypothetical protein GOP47_0016734 [Adiantum capillus-veneris]